jgi:hypothetical protein
MLESDLSGSQRLQADYPREISSSFGSGLDLATTFLQVWK